jgi:hypothetical protein
MAGVGSGWINIFFNHSKPDSNSGAAIFIASASVRALINLLTLGLLTL